MNFRDFLLAEGFKDVAALVAKYFRLDREYMDNRGVGTIWADGQGREVHITYTKPGTVKIDFDFDSRREIDLLMRGRGSPKSDTTTGFDIQDGSVEFARRMKALAADLARGRYRVHAAATDERRQKLYARHLGRAGFVQDGDFYDPK